MSMDSLEFSVIFAPEFLTALMERFDLPCRLESMTWGDAWGRMTRIALYRVGPEVSQIGTTWLDDLVALGSVRPFTDEEVEAIGGSSTFLPASWQTVSPPHWRSRVWAIPWLADVRVVIYWRDMLEEAGIDGETAFQTPERVEGTMERLQASGIAAPWGIWATTVNVALQNAASWVWGAGGDIVSADGKQILFDQPEAMEGFLTYFRLHRYMPPDLDLLLSDSQVIDWFIARRVAAIMGPGLWLAAMMNAFERDPDIAAKIGVALPPGPAFVGGSHLIMWQHTHRAQEAVELIRFLTSKQVQLDFCRRMGFLPVRLAVLSEPPYTTDARFQTMTEALKTGRTYPVVPKWGAVEEKLGVGLVWLWNTLLTDPDQDLDNLVRPYVEAIARRLTITLGIRR